MNKEKLYRNLRLLGIICTTILTILAALGIEIPAINESLITGIVTSLVTIFVNASAYWKNNNHTPEAMEGQVRLNELKNLKTSVMSEQKKAGIEILDEQDLPKGIGGAFTPRTSAPNSSNVYYRHISKGGVNPCIRIKGDSCLPNCVGYAYGRAYEILGKNPYLSVGNANSFYGHKDSWKRIKPNDIQPGDLICWDDGGYGHVGFVELKNDDGSFTISQSAYGGSRFYITKQKPPFNFGRYTCQGAIRIVTQTETEKLKEEKKETANKWLKYKKPFKVKVSISDLYLRSGAGTNTKKNGFVKPGVYTVDAVKYNSKDKNTWGRITVSKKKYWIALEYAKKVK